MNALYRELWFLSRNRAALGWLVVAFLVTTIAVATGIHEVHSQRAQLERLVQVDQSERKVVTGHLKDWGTIAYYTFHLTYSQPSNMAFSALGQRDTIPWKHRIRMLALEGQIYETDAINPTFALIGRFDFAFVASILLPLFVIFLVHGLRSDERTAGRFELLISTAPIGPKLWILRALLPLAWLALCLLIPFIGGSILEKSSISHVLLASAAVLIHILFWWVLADYVGRSTNSSTYSLLTLIGIWFWFAVLAPSFINIAVSKVIPLPEGGEILLTQREIVHDAWDIPKETTMTAFAQKNPEWKTMTDIGTSFDWKWYYAFQQVGDQQVEPLSQRYRSGRLDRDKLSGWLALTAPPVWLERTLESLASTDLRAALSYEQAVRNFHASLRTFYYPRLFEARPYQPSEVRYRPEFGKTVEKEPNAILQSNEATPPS